MGSISRLGERVFRRVGKSCRSAAAIAHVSHKYWAHRPQTIKAVDPTAIDLTDARVHEYANNDSRFLTLENDGRRVNLGLRMQF